MADLLAQAIFHTFLAALAVEALLRLWRVQEPRLRLAFRALPLVVPLLVLPAFALLAPAREADAFRDQWAIFVGARWADVRLFGMGLYGLWIALFAALGTGLFLMDLIPLALDRSSDRALAGEGATNEAEPLALALAEVAGIMQMTPPRTLLLERATPVLLCAGALHPVLVVSRGALHALDGDELRAALAHELGHVARRDPLASWVLMAARAVMFFNPAFQVVARLLARDAEWRADDDAVAATGGGLALASGLIKLYRTSEGRRRAPRLAWLPSLDGPLARLRTEAVAARCHRLIDGAGSRPLPLARTRLGLTAAALSLLLFFVV